MMEKRALYAYFGELGLFTDDIPGHSFYQIGLLDAISEHFSVDKFDFYNYLDVNRTIDEDGPAFPDDRIGKICNSFSKSLLLRYRLSYDHVWEGISHKIFSKLFLKARFRNLSTLAKGFKDAHRFEEIIQYAISLGYDPADIIIIDTDLSMSDSFRDTLNRLGCQIVVPSIDFPGIGQKFLAACMESHKEANLNRQLNIMYYGNLDFSNYKKGHQKNPIIFDVIKAANHQFMFDQATFKMIVAAKDSPKIQDFLNGKRMASVSLIPRTDRNAIWNALASSLVSVNVSKDLYLEKGFIPARVYESIIAGVIPVSYKKGQMEAMTFETVDDFYEIAKFLAECTPDEYFDILDKIASSL